MYPDELLYSKDHEWVRMTGKVATVGITHHAQESLGDVVFVELPAESGEVKAGEPFGVVESVKTASDLYSPVSGRVVEVNEELLESPELINSDPYGKAWMIRVEVTNPGELEDLLSAQAYKDLISD